MKSVIRWLCIGLLAVFAATAHAQTDAYPSKPIRILVGYSPGGGMDTIARALAQRLEDILGVSVVVDNRPGATGTIAANAVAQATPDGYTLLLGETGLLVAPVLFASLPFDLTKSFTPVGYVAQLPMAFALTNDFPAKTVPELIATLKAAPGKYDYASPGVGSVQHLAFEQFKRVTGVDVQHVPYKGATAMTPDLIAGRVHIAILSSSAAVGLARANTARIVGVTSLERSSNLPEVPPIADVIPNFDMSARVFLLAPAGTPASAIAKLEQAVAAALKNPELQKRFSDQGASVIAAGSQETQRQMTEEMERWGSVARSLNVKPQ
ncbi:Bug family tripartite tricarboxylate transporter substrate binding protein [Pseudorhodoplanes sp.]|uniref:Bug family tripartite tricarboxylate transporter substrate binding protein n=1 Tax=Pseudorhodoplanes sp. TaxID=1934341 RepID=UPI00391DAAF5